MVEMFPLWESTIPFCKKLRQVLLTHLFVHHRKIIFIKNGMSWYNYFSKKDSAFITFMDMTITNRSAKFTFEIKFMVVIRSKTWKTLASKCFKHLIVKFNSECYLNWALHCKNWGWKSIHCINSCIESFIPKT